MAQWLNKNRQLVILGLVLLFLILMVLYVFLINPTSEEIDSKKTEIHSLEQNRTLYEKKIVQKQQAGSDFNSNEIQSAIPLWDNTEQLLYDLTKIGEATHTEFRSISFARSENNQLQGIIGGEASQYPSIRELKASIVLDGTYIDIMNWIESMQLLPRLIVIDSFSLEKPDESKMSLPITVIINFTTYFDNSYADKVDGILLPSK
ncbi:MAG: type 4a pilus biogenesis protein PilO [Candidatus Cohnella colombiensis]|uniref:Type 4a pilus biogenesis protein PilO n=1 Tax=Candidatus Cohnella colombiensis TaxID=3121368 RepID=A0AA95J9J9_9BACL|nr:MAG: type 4a pilus biogenesis protein PilO [Cohnella sp.]